jgi:hypothetical protein
MLSNKLSAYLLLALISMVIITPTVFSQPQLEVTVTTEKSAYHYRQLVNIYGNVTYGGELVQDGLVAIQLQDPNNKTLALRTVPANATPVENWAVEITSFLSTDSSGTPQDTFNKGSNAWFKVSVRNNDPFENRTVLLIIVLYDMDSTPFQIHWLLTDINPQASVTEMVRLSLTAYDGGSWVSTGSATAYANVLTDWPSNGGYPYSPEKSTTFTITSGSGTASASTNSTLQANESSYTSYNASIRLPPNVALGAYKITVSAYYRGFKNVFNIAIFNREYEIRGDILLDHEINIFDVVIIASAYGTQGGDSKWNPEADLEPDGKVDIFDVVIVAGEYGATY